MTAYTASLTGEAGAGDRLASIIGRTTLSLKRAWTRHRTQLILSDLDDHVLRDIGLNPREIRPEPVSLRLLSVPADSRLMSPHAFGR
jgi:uncharacterized protein YjiS (DUF1127 family)